MHGLGLACLNSPQSVGASTARQLHTSGSGAHVASVVVRIGQHVDLLEERLVVAPASLLVSSDAGGLDVSTSSNASQL